MEQTIDNDTLMQLLNDCDVNEIVLSQYLSSPLKLHVYDTIVYNKSSDAYYLRQSTAQRTILKLMCPNQKFHDVLFCKQLVSYTDETNKIPRGVWLNVRSTFEPLRQYELTIFTNHIYDYFRYTAPYHMKMLYTIITNDFQHPIIKRWKETLFVEWSGLK